MTHDVEHLFTYLFAIFISSLCLNLLLIFCVCVLFVLIFEFGMSFINSGYKSFIRYVTCKYSLSGCDLPFIL